MDNVSVDVFKPHKQRPRQGGVGPAVFTRGRFFQNRLQSGPSLPSSCLIWKVVPTLSLGKNMIYRLLSTVTGSLCSLQASSALLSIVLIVFQALYENISLRKIFNHSYNIHTSMPLRILYFTMVHTLERSSGSSQRLVEG